MESPDGTDDAVDAAAGGADLGTKVGALAEREAFGRDGGSVAGVEVPATMGVLARGAVDPVEAVAGVCPSSVAMLTS